MVEEKNKCGVEVADHLQIRNTVMDKLGTGEHEMIDRWHIGPEKLRQEDNRVERVGWTKSSWG